MASKDPRPEVWIGHITLATSADTLEATHQFMLDLGMRAIVKGDDFAVLELRGGTHLVVLATDDPQAGDAGFDLMVEDLDATHARYREAGLAPSEIEPGKIHSSFVVRTPSGHDIKFNSSHVSDLPV